MAHAVPTGIFGTPVLGDLDGDGFLDIVVAAMDQHVYAWDRHGSPLPGWPVLVQDPNPGGGQMPAGAESINTPVLADLDGDGRLEVVIETNEVYDATGNESQFFPNDQGTRPRSPSSTRAPCSPPSSPRLAARAASTPSTTTAPTIPVGRSSPRLAGQDRRPRGRRAAADRPGGTT